MTDSSCLFEALSRTGLGSESPAVQRQKQGAFLKQRRRIRQTINTGDAVEPLGFRARH